ncbi:MAG: CopG family ribbon-helix-helix protein [Thermodesulfobacteriota bacterium]
MQKTTTTLRLPDERLRLIKAIAGYEGRSVSEIFSELTEEYIERHLETLELLNIPGFVDECRAGLDEIKRGGGKNIVDMGD